MKKELLTVGTNHDRKEKIISAVVWNSDITDCKLSMKLWRLLEAGKIVHVELHQNSIVIWCEESWYKYLYNLL